MEGMRKYAFHIFGYWEDSEAQNIVFGLVA